MADQTDPESMPDQWNEIVAQMNDQWVEGMEASTEAQAGFIESWVDAFESIQSEEYSNESLQSNTQAYEMWMEAAEETAEKVAAAASGETVSPNEIRDLWLDNANEMFKEVMSTDAFAAMTGQNLEEALEYRQQVDESAQETLHELGFATEGDIREVGERLVELERRQRKLERGLERLDEMESKLDRVLERLERPA